MASLPLPTTVSSDFSGDLIVAGDPRYDEARAVRNGLIDKRPELIARCRSVVDVVEALRFAREQQLEIAVRGGGHNVSGRATTDGGVLIDLSAMRGLHVDPARRVARAEGGQRWREFNRETQAHGLATTGGAVSTTGIAGLTLGGGLGWLMGTCGLAADNLTSAQLVSADGRILTASADEHRDLFWAIRGGGGNFGIASSFEYRLHPIGPLVTGGLIAYPFAAARDVMRFYRDFTASLPDELTAFFALVHAPDASGAKLAAIVVCHCGPTTAGETAVAVLKRFGKPVMDALGPIPYVQMNRILDDGLPRGARNYWKSSFIRGIDEGLIEAAIDSFARASSPMCTILIEHFHGEVTRVAVDATAFPHRREGYNMLVLGQWMDPAETERHMAWTRETYAALQPFAASGRFMNYLDSDESGDPAAAAYGPNYPRLQKVKAIYDPENIFKLNINIRPAR